jgi:magnesium-transporting ATPase (P-type)
MNNSGTFQFLLTDLQSKQIASFDLLNATVYCDLWENTKATIITRSASSWRFGQVNFALTNNATTAPVKNYVVTMIVTSVVFIVIFALAALGLFFYQKNKYKNDEFNRVVPKEYVKKASVAFAYLLLWTEEILSLLARNIFFRNSLIVFNPFDVLIIIFSIILIIYTGYYIKYFLARFKDWRVKRMEERLKLGDSIADDGTVTTKK